MTGAGGYEKGRNPQATAHEADALTFARTPRCWAVHARELVRCGRGADHEGPHVGMTGQDKFVEWADA